MGAAQIATTTSVTLDDLVGLHNLSGCDTSIEQIERYDCTEDASVIRFILDGLTYTAVENPVDGYPSCMEKIFVDNVPIRNAFAPTKVMAFKKPRDRSGDHDTLVCIDVVTGLVVLEVGTDRTDDYYPTFIASFNPENMAVNSAVRITLDQENQ